MALGRYIQEMIRIAGAAKLVEFARKKRVLKIKPKKVVERITVGWKILIYNELKIEKILVSIKRKQKSKKRSKEIYGFTSRNRKIALLLGKNLSNPLSGFKMGRFYEQTT